MQLQHRPWQLRRARPRVTDPIVIVGSGFAGTILARALHATGKPVLLVERGMHPRFALGESSTPLASISLERLAATYGLPDLLALSAYGRWNRALPEVRHGLKRGFTFYGHRRDRPFVNGEHNEARLVVAASPDDEIADSHWMRADVDHYLVQQAVAEGVPFRDHCRIDHAETGANGWRLSATHAGEQVSIDASFVVDAAGGASFLPTEGPTPNPSPIRSGLVFGHFTSVGPFLESARADTYSDAPYPEERAAVHHLLEEGWMYVLSFDDGGVSAGFVIDHEHADAGRLLDAEPESAWAELLSRYPSIGRQFERAVPLRPIASIRTIQRHRGPAAGETWARLPNAFHFMSPMFSTGIAWSLVAVERLARILGGDSSAQPWALEEYRRLLDTEARYLDELIAPAYLQRKSFETFSAWTSTYFAAASYSEVWQRLCDPPGDAEWSSLGFLGSCDPALRTAARRAGRLLRREVGHGTPDPLPEGIERMIAGLLRARNLGEFGDPRRGRVYPIDLGLLEDRASLLGLEPDQIRQRLSRLRGPL